MFVSMSAVAGSTMISNPLGVRDNKRAQTTAILPAPGRTFPDIGEEVPAARRGLAAGLRMERVRVVRRVVRSPLVADVAHVRAAVVAVAAELGGEELPRAAERGGDGCRAAGRVCSGEERQALPQRRTSA